MIERWIASASAAGLIAVSEDQYRTLTLTPAGRAVMAGRIEEVQMLVPAPARRSAPRRRRRSVRPTFRAFNIVEAGSAFVERLNQIDLRVAKIFRVGGTRTNINFDFFNVLNSNAVIGENATYAPPPSTSWRTPQTMLVPRLFTISAQFAW